MSDIERLIASYASGALSRRSFMRRLLALGVSMGFVETLLGPGARRALAAPLPSTPARSPRFVLVVLDAFRSDYLQLAHMPFLQWLIEIGTFYPRAWVGQLESYTPTSHATLSTGATPAHQGVIGFSWRDPTTGQEDYTAWYQDVIAGRLEQQLEQHGVNSIPRAVKQHDSNAIVVAVSSEKYYAADAMGGTAADYILYGMPQGTRITTQGIPRHLPPEQFLQIPELSRPWPLKFGQFDELAMTMALEALTNFDPRVLMINLPGPDIYGHRYGGPANSHVMASIARSVDRELGRLLAAFRDRGIFDQTVFVVTADHGMVSNTGQVNMVRLKQAIRDAGGDYLFDVGGSSSFIWLRNPAAAPQVARGLLKTLHNTSFAHYQTIEAGSYHYHPVTRPGSHLGAALEAANQYLLGTFAGPLAPDIVLSFPENTITRIHQKAHGEHGGATWGAQQVPLVIAGPGVRAGYQSQFPARLMDVAPTVLALMDIEPTNMDGVVLADGLRRPTDEQVSAQDDLRPRLTAHQRAIITRSEADTKKV